MCLVMPIHPRSFHSSRVTNPFCNNQCMSSRPSPVSIAYCGLLVTVCIEVSGQQTTLWNGVTIHAYARATAHASDVRSTTVSLSLAPTDPIPLTRYGTRVITSRSTTPLLTPISTGSGAGSQPAPFHPSFTQRLHTPTQPIQWLPISNNPELDSSTSTKT